MEFVLLSSTEFRKFATSSPYKTFMQTPEIAAYRASEGWKFHYLAVKRDGQIAAAAVMFTKPTFMGKSICLTPGGPLLDYEDTELASFFLSELKKFASRQGGYVLRISPYYELIERGRHGERVEGGFDHSGIIETLHALGFRTLEDTNQPKYLFALDIDGRRADQIFAEFKSNTRNLIHRAERIGVKVRELDKPELKILKQITESTSMRRNFTDRTLSYYEKMYDLFVPRGEAKFIIADAKIDNCIVPLSAAMFMLYGDEVIYLFSGSDKKYMHDYAAQYLIQWHMIKYAVEHGFKRYNFYGIQGLPDASSSDYGIYVFKKGFGGHVVELAGTFEAALDPLYYFHAILSRIKETKGHLKRPRR